MTYEALPADERKSVRENAKRLHALAGYQYAQLCMAEAALMIRETFPAAAKIVIDVDYDDFAALWRINDANGAVLWNRDDDQPSAMPLADAVSGLYAEAKARHSGSCGIVLDQDDESHGEASDDVYRYVVALRPAAHEA